MSIDGVEEKIFQNDILDVLHSNGYRIGESKFYNKKLALYPEDLLEFVKTTQEKSWNKFSKLYPDNTNQIFLERVASQLNKVNPNAANKELRTYGTLGVLRHGIKDRGVRFDLYQPKPVHNLNPDTLNKYEKNILRAVPEVVYSPYLKDDDGSKKYRIDIVIFINGIPIITMELKSEFKQAVESAINQYKTDRLPVVEGTSKKEPLLTFKRGALVHFAVSQYEIYMTTKLQGKDTTFLPFNKGTRDGGAGNDIPADIESYATDYLWNEVLLKDNILNILARYIHLDIKEKEEWDGKKYKTESMIFPRYHQWDVVSRLINAAKEEGAGNKYLIQHSAGSGKSNSIAWSAHQLSSLYNNTGNKIFDSVIVVTDRTVLDNQLQETIYQFEHADGIVGRISNEIGSGSKSEKLAEALKTSQPIIIVTIQTFPFVIDVIENDVNLQKRCYAVIADEAHSSQSGKTSRQLKEVLGIKGSEKENLSTDEIIDKTLESRKKSDNVSFFAFTATPKPKTMELFGRLPNPDAVPSQKNIPKPFHIYTMRQAIEEGFILDVLKNYTNYKTAYRLSLKFKENDKKVETRKARVKVNQWVKLHEHNISQKVKIIVEHFRDNVMNDLGGQAKAMVVTGSRKEAVRYKLSFDKYIKEKKYEDVFALIAFSGEVEFNENDPNAADLLNHKFSEKNMNSQIGNKDLRESFDKDNYQLMIVANKFQTGFDQPKLCAMYVDKKLAGVDCVQTLSRLNRIYPGKSQSGTYVLDFFNEREDILEAFQPYYENVQLKDVTDPNAIYDLFEKIIASKIFLWEEVEQYCKYFFQKKKKNAALSNICKPAVTRWKERYKKAIDDYKTEKNLLEETKKTNNPTLIANAENRFQEVQKQKNFLEIFKKDLGTYVRFYEFVSQIVDFDDRDLEKLSIYARNLRPLLRQVLIEDDKIDLSNVEMTHFRLSKLKEGEIKLQSTNSKLSPGNGPGTAKPKTAKQESLEKILDDISSIFDDENLSKQDMINYALTIRDKVKENEQVTNEIKINTKEQALLGNFNTAILSAILASDEAHQDQKMQLLTDEVKQRAFTSLIFDLLDKENN